MTGLLKKLLVQVLVVSLLSAGSPMMVQAEIIGTLAGLESAQRDADLARVSRALATAEAREQLQALGVDQAQVEARLARLTDSELSTLADRLDQAPAGGVDILAVIGVVFVVLLILEAVGVIDVFKKFP
jgi:RecB family exonuclease